MQGAREERGRLVPYFRWDAAQYSFPHRRHAPCIVVSDRRPMPPSDTLWARFYCTPFLCSLQRNLGNCDVRFLVIWQLPFAELQATFLR